MIGHTIIGFEMEKDEEGNDWPVFTVEKTYPPLQPKTTATKVRHKLVISRDSENVWLRNRSKAFGYDYRRLAALGFVFMEAGEDESITIPEKN